MKYTYVYIYMYILIVYNPHSLNNLACTLSGLIPCPSISAIKECLLAKAPS